MAPMDLGLTSGLGDIGLRVYDVGRRLCLVWAYTAWAMVKHPYQESLDCLLFLQGCFGSVFSPPQNVACLKGRDLSCTDAAPGFLIDFTAFAVLDCLFVLWWQGVLKLTAYPLSFCLTLLLQRGSPCLSWLAIFCLLTFLASNSAATSKQSSNPNAKIPNLAEQSQSIRQKALQVESW